MEEQKKPAVTLSEEQLDALVQSLLPVMQEFFSSDRGKRIWAEHLEKFSRAKRMWIDSIPPESQKNLQLSL